MTCRVLDVEPVRGDKLIALATIELEVAGVCFTLHGVQMQHGPQGGA